MKLKLEKQFQRNAKSFEKKKKGKVLFKGFAIRKIEGKETAVLYASLKLRQKIVWVLKKSFQDLGFAIKRFFGFGSPFQAPWIRRVFILEDAMLNGYRDSKHSYQEKFRDVAHKLKACVSQNPTSPLFFLFEHLVEGSHFDIDSLKFSSNQQQATKALVNLPEGAFIPVKKDKNLLIYYNKKNPETLKIEQHSLLLKKGAAPHSYLLNGTPHTTLSSLMATAIGHQHLKTFYTFNQNQKAQEIKEINGVDLADTATSNFKTRIQKLANTYSPSHIMQAKSVMHYMESNWWQAISLLGIEAANIPFILNEIEKDSPRQAWLIREELKNLGHEFGLRGSFTVGKEKNKAQVTLEGSFSFMSTSLLGESTVHFLEEEKNKSDSLLSKNFSKQQVEAIEMSMRQMPFCSRTNLTTSEKKNLLEKINRGEPVTFLPTWAGHALGASISNGYIAITNRGQRDFETFNPQEPAKIKIYRYQQPMTMQLLDGLLNNSQKNTLFKRQKRMRELEGRKPGSLFHDHKLGYVGHIEKSRQTVGNCGYANAKGALHSTLLLTKLSEMNLENPNQTDVLKANQAPQAIFKDFQIKNRLRKIQNLSHFFEVSKDDIFLLDVFKLRCEIASKIYKDEKFDPYFFDFSTLPKIYRDKNLSPEELGQLDIKDVAIPIKQGKSLKSFSKLIRFSELGATLVFENEGNFFQLQKTENGSLLTKMNPFSFEFNTFNLNKLAFFPPYEETEIKKTVLKTQKFLQDEIRKNLLSVGSCIQRFQNDTMPVKILAQDYADGSFILTPGETAGRATLTYKDEGAIKKIIINYNANTSFKYLFDKYPFLRCPVFSQKLANEA